MLGRAALIVAPAAEATEVADDPAVLVCEPIVELSMLVAASEDETPVAVPGTAADPEAALAEVPPGLSMRRSE